MPSTITRLLVFARTGEDLAHLQEVAGEAFGCGNVTSVVTAHEAKVLLATLNFHCVPARFLSSVNQALVRGGRRSGGGGGCFIGRPEPAAAS